MNNREIRGMAIISKGDTPKALSSNEYVVPSQSSDEKYNVKKTEEWTCTCPDFEKRQAICKHIHAVSFFVKMQNKVEMDELEDENKEKCPHCKTEEIIKRGKRKTKTGVKQRYYCSDCDKRFVLSPVKKIKGNAKTVCLVMDLYYKRLSLRYISDTLHQFYGLYIHHETVRRWIKNFGEQINKYVETLKPKTSDI